VFILIEEDEEVLISKVPELLACTPVLRLLFEILPTVSIFEK
jgi:hypothetical protein